MPLADLLVELFKVKTRAVENPRAVTTATATAQMILANNPNRLAWTMINLGGNPCYIGLTREVSASNGVRLDINGGHAGEIWNEDFQETAWAVWIISPDGDSNCYSKEVVEY
ncbi:unnamed protein product [marine sediment metagenome]|uniref:Uncharacterized protein n=1 Tax=marine sediment metagenome TaxID=412755 RepID=X1TVQ8_9ZZZZ